MTILASWQHHRLRWIGVAIAVIVVALVVVAVIRVYALLQPQRFTSLLEHDLARAGITLSMQAPARPTLFPRPAVRTQGFSLTNAGSSTPILRARSAMIVVPWRALLHGEAAIESVRVDAPHIDLGELRKLLARLPHRPGPPQLPTIATGVHLVDGTISRSGSPLLFDVSLDTGELVAGHPFQVTLSAHGADGEPISASLVTVPSAPHHGSIEFGSIEFDLAKHDGILMRLQGAGQWHGGEALALQLHGTLAHPMLAPPPSTSAAPATSSAAATASTAASGATESVDHVAIDVTPPSAGAPLEVALKVNGTDSQADLHLQPTEFGGWWQRVLSASSGHPPGPMPITGTAQIKSLDLGAIKATGLHIVADHDLAPASAVSATPAPATSAAH